MSNPGVFRRGDRVVVRGSKGGLYGGELVDWQTDPRLSHDPALDASVTDRAAGEGALVSPPVDLSKVKSGDTLTVVDHRGDVWTGVVRSAASVPGLFYGPGVGEYLRPSATNSLHVLGSTVKEIRDHVPHIEATPEPPLRWAVIEDARGRKARSLVPKERRDWRWAGVGTVANWDEFAQPVKVLFEGVEERTHG